MGEFKKQLSVGILMLVALAMASTNIAAAAEGKVNINTAGIEELSLLPRVGSVVAERIVEFREANGAFEAAEDLMLVKGIGERTFELIEPHVALKGETSLTEKVRTPRQAKAEEQE